MDVHKCEVFDKVCKNKHELLYHEKRSCKSLKCSDCNTKFKRRRDLERHRKNQKKTWCDDCQHMACNSMQWTQHMNSHKKVPEYLKICNLSQFIHPRTGYEDYGYQKLQREKASEIRDKETESLYKKVVNKKIDYTYTFNDLYKELLKIYEYQTNAFKVNLGFGFILYNINTEEFKYFYCSTNNLLFQHAVTINNWQIS